MNNLQLYDEILIYVEALNYDQRKELLKQLKEKVKELEEKQ